MWQRVAPGRRFGPYELVEEVGRGGSAVVFRASDGGRDVAVKVIAAGFTADDTFRARFRQEAELISRLDHPHILPVLDSGEGEGDDVAYLVTEFMPGGSLETHLLGERTTRERCLLALGVAQQIGGALDYAHEQGVLHRDVKPSNVLMDAGGHFVLADFGLARVFAHGASLHLTATGLVAGTPAYMAPEQALGEPADTRTDLYGLAVVLYEIVTGRVPFHAETPLATMLAQVHQPPPPPRQLAPQTPRAVDAVLLHALAKARDDRYGSGAELTAAMHAAVAAAFGQSALATGELPRVPAPARQARAPQVRAPALAARRPRRFTRMLRGAAAVASSVALLAAMGGGGAAIALGPGRMTLAELAERFVASSVGPAWTEAFPTDGALNQPLQLSMAVRFSHEMDHPAVEGAISLQPEVEVEYIWDRQMVFVVPKQDLREGTTYTLTIDSARARDAQGRPLARSLRRRFTTLMLPAQAAPAAAIGPALPLFPPALPAQPTPERPQGAIEPLAGVASTPRPAGEGNGSGQRQPGSGATPTPPIPLYAPATMPAQAPDTGVVAGAVFSADDPDTVAGEPPAPAPTPSPAVPATSIALVNAPPATGPAAPAATATIGSGGRPAPTANSAVRSPVPTASPSATPARASAATATATVVEPTMVGWIATPSPTARSASTPTAQATAQATAPPTATAAPPASPTATARADATPVEQGTATPVSGTTGTPAAGG